MNAVARAARAVMALVVRIRSDEPLRARILPLIAAAAALVVARGWVDADQVQMILGVTFLVLGAGATELARAKVTPMTKVLEQTGAAFADGVTSGAQSVVDQVTEHVDHAVATLPPQVQDAVARIRTAIEAGAAPYIGEHRAP